MMSQCVVVLGILTEIAGFSEHSTSSWSSFCSDTHSPHFLLGRSTGSAVKNEMRPAGSGFTVASKR